MKLNRTYFFIALSALALFIVLIIQVRWILQTAKMKENLFNEKANIVLTKTAEALSLDKEACRNLQISTNKNDLRKVDSLFNYYMKIYNIHIDYSFQVRPVPITFSTLDNYNVNNEPRSYQTCITGEKETDNLELNLVFPEKKQYILAEMGVPFITSVLLILVVIILSSRTMLSLLKEKKISEHTTDFLNNMTHEFKTPLTNIGLAGKMLVRDSPYGQEEKIRHFSGIILEENEKLKQQVEQVLSMTALERGEIRLQNTELDFHQLIKDSLKSFQLQMELKHGTLLSVLHAHHFIINGDKSHLTHALCNLIDNSLKYSNDNPEISVRTYNHEHQLIIQVADKGIGIRKEYQKKVFTKYFRVATGDLHDVKGFGLGLAYVKMIIELHGGTISLQSETGNGTIFTIALPYV